MNAPAPIRRAPTLAELKAERRAIRARLASIKETRAKLEEANAAVDEARGELEAAAKRHEALVEKWADGGCKGSRPEPAFDDHAAFETSLRRAQHAAESTRPARAALDVREAEASRALFDIERPIKLAAVDILCSKLDELADETIELRKKVTANEASILAAHVLIRDIGKKTDRDGRSTVDSAFYHAAMRVRGIDFPGREEWRPIDAESSKYWEEELDKLVSNG